MSFQVLKRVVVWVKGRNPFRREVPEKYTHRILYLSSYHKTYLTEEEFEKIVSSGYIVAIAKSYSITHWSYPSEQIQEVEEKLRKIRLSEAIDKKVASLLDG